MSREAMKLALEALEGSIALTMPKIDLRKEAIAALREALAQPQQEPVAEVQVKMTGGNAGISTVIREILDPLREPLSPGEKLYTSPPARKPLFAGLIAEHQGLADELAAIDNHQSPIGKVVWAAGVPNTIKEVRWFDFIGPSVGTDLYTSPPARNPLTVEQIEEVWVAYEKARPKNSSNHESRLQFARAIEAAHGIKDTP